MPDPGRLAYLGLPGWLLLWVLAGIAFALFGLRIVRLVRVLLKGRPEVRWDRIPRRLWTFLTNDRRARNYCRQAGLRVYDLAALLRALWRGGIRSPQFMQELCARMEAAEGMTIPNKEAIFRK